MSVGEDLINTIHAEVMRVLHRTTRRTPVIVDAYDKKTHAVKLKLQPDSVKEDVITGWIPLHTVQTGNKSGWFSPPNVKDHGWLEFSDDDREGGTFTHAAFNDQFPPDDTVEAGELKYIHPATQAQLYFKKDGSITLRGKNNSNANGGNSTGGTDGKGGSGSSDNSKQTFVMAADGSVLVQDKSGNASLKIDGQGNMIYKAVNFQVDCTTFTVLATGDAGIKSGGNSVYRAQNTIGISAGNEAVWQSGGDVADHSVTPPGSAPGVPPFQTP